jgi:hypothetical protein
MVVITYISLLQASTLNEADAALIIGNNGIVLDLLKICGK